MIGCGSGPSCPPPPQVLLHNECEFVTVTTVVGCFQRGWPNSWRCWAGEVTKGYGYCPHGLLGWLPGTIWLAVWSICSILIKFPYKLHILRLRGWSTSLLFCPASSVWVWNVFFTSPVRRCWGPAKASVCTWALAIFTTTNLEGKWRFHKELSLLWLNKSRIWQSLI